MKIKFKMIFTFTLLNLIILLSLLAATYFTLETDTNRKYRDELERLTESIDIQIIDLLDKTVDDFLMASAKKSSEVLKALNKYVSSGTLELSEAQDVYINSLVEQVNSSVGHGFITDNDGKIIYHKNKDLIGKSSSYKSWITENLRKHYIFKREMSEGKSKVAIKFYFSSWDWQIVYEMDYEEVYSILDFEKFNNTINNITVGVKGYPYVLSTHGLFITHPLKEYRYEGQYEMTDAEGFPFIKYIIQEKDGYVEYEWEEDGKQETKVAHFKLIPNTSWIIVAGGYKAEFFETNNYITGILLIIVLVSLLISTVLTLLFSSALVKPITRFNMAIQDLAEGEGDLTQSVQVSSKDEMGEMARNLNTFIQKLRDIIQQIKSVSVTTNRIKEGLVADTAETSGHVTGISDNIGEINRRVGNLGTTVELASGNVREITTSINVLGEQIVSQNAMIEESSAAITEMIASIDNVADITAKKQAVTSQLVDTTRKGLNVVEMSMDSVKQISTQLEGINSMATIISNIASETNILAMNAAIEAAHAGESGKGFAVVAEEIRKLAESSNESSNKIKDLLMNVNESMERTNSLSGDTISSIQEIETEINSFVQAFDEISHSSTELKVGGKEMIQAIEVLREISIKVKESSNSINNLTEGVNQAMTETSEVSRNVISRVSEINSKTENITGSMERVNTNTKELENAGDELDSQVNKFKV